MSDYSSCSREGFADIAAMLSVITRLETARFS